MARLLLDLGADGRGHRHDDAPDPAGGDQGRARRALVGRLRGSVLLLGPLLAREVRAHVAPPGGDFPRAPDHSHALEALQRHGRGWSRARARARGARRAQGGFHLPGRGVGHGHRDGAAAAAAAPGVSEIRHAACEPHVVELCEFLRRWAWASGAAPTRSVSRAAAAFRGAAARCGATTSRPEAGPWSAPSPAANRGRRHAPVDMEVVSSVLRKMRVECSRTTTCSASAARALNAGRITTGLWPGFPSDLVSLVTVLATQAEGRHARARLAVRAAAVRAGAD
jgi:UDP-N-acetylglucosamine 1-carboxyvinyltransferase